MIDDTLERRDAHVELTAKLVSAYVSKNPVPMSDLSGLITSTYAAISCLHVGPEPVVEDKQRPAVPIRKSMTADYLVCLEDGKKFKSLKRHLSTHYDMTPQQYREKWNLPPDYPMVAPNYSAARSSLAKSMGLGRKAEPEAQPARPAARKKLGLRFT